MDSVCCLQLPVDRIIVVVIIIIITYFLFLFLLFIQEKLAQAVKFLILIRKVSLSNLG